MRRVSTWPARMVGVVVVLTTLQMATAVPVPLAEYRFEETGTTAINSGSLGAAGNLTMGTSQASPTDRHSPVGDGVWYISPRALDHRFGDTSVSARAVSSGSLSALDNLAGLTVAGWYLSERSDRLVGNERQLVVNTETSPGFRVEGGEIANVESALRFAVNGGAVVSGLGTYPDPGSAKYTFFAITFDGSAGSNNVKFYRGYTNTPASLVSTVSLAVSNTGVSGEPLALGGRIGFNAPRTFHGLLDDVRIYGSVLTASDIEDVRLSSLPEPGSIALVLCGGMMVLRRGSRQNRWL